jgi:hypothetical protein
LAFAAKRALAEGAPKKVLKGRESDMNAGFKANSCLKRPAGADLLAVLRLVAGSAIRPVPAPVPVILFSDWEQERKSPNVDAMILAWIASHVPGSPHRGRLH